MNFIRIPYREAIPVRALPFVAGSEGFPRAARFPPSLIIQALHQAQDASTAGIPSLRAYALKDGKPTTVDSMALDIAAPISDFPPEIDEPIRDSFSRLPPGMFVFLDDLRAYMNWLLPPGALGGQCREEIEIVTELKLPEAVISTIYQGFDDARKAEPEQRHSPTVNEDNRNPSLCVFRTMPSLNPAELKVEIAAGDSGGIVLNISARGTSRRVSLGEIELFDKRKAEPNEQFGVLLGLSTKRPVPKSKEKAVSNIRGIFKRNLGISADPFMRTENGYEALFTIEDKRNAADRRAKEHAERSMISIDELSDQGQQFAANRHEFDSDDDAAGKWLAENDR